MQNNYSTVNGDSGNDTISNITYYSSINGGSGNDSIYNYSYYSTINGGSGNDTVSLYSSAGNNIIQFTQGSGNDIVYGYTESNKISLGTNDAYNTVLSGSNILISLTSGDVMTLSGAKGKTVNIVGGKFNDTVGKYIYNNNTNTLLGGGAGKDTIVNYGGGATIRAGAGNDSIYNSTLYTVKRSYGYVTIDGGDGNDTITSFDPYVSIYGGSGADRISLGGYWQKITIKGGTGNDSILTNSDRTDGVIYQFSSGDGNDLVTNWSANDSVSLSGGYYSTVVNGSNVVLSMTNGYSGSITLQGASNKTVNIKGGTLFGGNYGKYIYNNNTNSLLSGTSYADTINNYAGGVTILGGAGNDSIYNSTLYKVKGSYGYVTIDGGEGNDTITSYDPYVSINGGAGNDSIKLGSWKAITVKGGTGNDSILTNIGRTDGIIYQFSSGDGNDLVTNWSANDSVSLSGGYYSTVVSGSNVLLNMTNGYSGSVTLNGAKGKTVKIVGGTLYGGNSDGGGSSGSTVSQQDIIKKFMKALDTTNNSSTAALNEAVKAASGGYFTNISAVINSMVEDCRRTNNATTFLKNYCGIDLSNSDTGAITGLDAGGSTVAKTASGIVPESGNLNSFTGSSFTTNGLTVKLGNFQNEYNPIAMSYSSLSNNTQRYIWQAFQTWWASSSLNLITQSYGSNYGFTSSSSATVKEMYFGFRNDNDSTLAATPYTYYTTSGKTFKLGMYVNMKYYNAMTIGNVDGKSSATNFYLDRTLAHEFTHAVMAANINHFNDLPEFISEGMAELTHGIDDERTSVISAIAGNSTRLKNALALVPGTGTSDAYAGGYMFLRYLAKQASLNYPSSSSSANVATSRSVSNNIGAGSTGSSLVTLKSDLLTVSKDFNDDMLDMNEYSSAKTVDTTKLADGIMIVGNKNANSISAGIGSDTISANTGNDTVRGGAGNDIILGDAGNDKLFGDAGNDSISGGTGDDTLTGGAGKDIFIHVADNDFIVDYISGEDKIKLAEEHASVSSSTVSGNNVILNINGTRKITIKDGANKNITVIDGNGKETTKKYTSTPVTLQTATDSSANTITAGANVKVIDASKRTSAVKITGNALANTISGGSKNDSLYGGAGNDSILGNAGNDKLFGEAGNDSLYGGAGNDTLSGGKGDDHLWGNAGKDMFLYASGDGKDVIHGFESGDLLQITGTNAVTSSYDKSKKEIYFNVDSTTKAITLAGFGNTTTFHVNGDTYQLQNNQLKKK